MSNRVSGTTHSLGSQIAAWLKQSRTQSETRIIQVESPLNSPIDVMVHLESTKETVMPECASCGHRLEEPVWTGESGDRYCSESCMRDKNDSPAED